MPTVFKSKATGDLVMVNAHADQILHFLGKNAKEPGILQPHEMAHALSILRSLPERSLADEADKQECADHPHITDSCTDSCADVPMSGDISLRKRSWPLVRMIEAAQAAEQAIVWGV